MVEEANRKNAEQFLDLYGDPKKNFTGDKRVTDDVDLNVENLKPLGVTTDSIFL